MSKYNCDFYITSIQLLPINKRKEAIRDIMYSLHTPIKEVELIFTYLREGSAAGDYNDLTVYNFGDLVNYQRRMYYRNEVTEGYASGTTPNTSKYFVRVLDNTTGLNERIRFSPQKILLEYALNKIFETTFNQPPGLSDIYITNENTDDDAFFVGQFDNDTSVITQGDNADWYISQFDTTTLVPAPDFIVHVPYSTFTPLAGTDQERENIILSVVNKYKQFGYRATILPY